MLLTTSLRRQRWFFCTVIWFNPRFPNTQPCCPTALHILILLFSGSRTLLQLQGSLGQSGRRRRQCKRHRCPTGGGSGNPLIDAVREAVIEIRLESQCARFHIP